MNQKLYAHTTKESKIEILEIFKRGFKFRTLCKYISKFENQIERLSCLVLLLFYSGVDLHSQMSLHLHVHLFNFCSISLKCRASYNTLGQVFFASLPRKIFFKFALWGYFLWRTYMTCHREAITLLDCHF